MNSKQEEIIMSRYKGNRNLTTTFGDPFESLSTLNKYHLAEQYLARIKQVLDNSLNEHPRTLVIRADLHFPGRINCPDYPGHYGPEVITRFFESLKAQIRADEKRKNKEGRRAHLTTLRYIWAKEICTAQQPHYHLALFLNKDAYFGLGDYREVRDNLAGRIYRAWARALHLHDDEIVNLIHFPRDTPYYHLERKDSKMYQEVFRRISYLAKTETKHYGSRSKNFGYSRK